MNEKFLTDPVIDKALADSANTTVAISISGGKDSTVLTLETNRHLDNLGFTGNRVLIHSDLGEIEHFQSAEICRKLGERLNLHLHIIKPKRPMIERWQYRWECITNRFINLENVRLSTWASSARNRFCTSESKTSPICRFLKKTYPGQTILNVIGLRRQESRGRAAKPVSQQNNLLTVKTKKTFGITWHPILDYTLEDVFLTHRQCNFPLHEAYTKFGLSRVSCSFCVLAGESDLQASLSDERNHPAFRRIAELEIQTTFSFKDGFWLADLAPQLLSQEQQKKLSEAKEKAARRKLADRKIPEELLFDRTTKFPAFQPDINQSARLGEARGELGAILDLPVKYTNAQEVYDRYAELIELKAEKEKTRKIKPKAQRTLF